jgi:hypothetical protein
VRRSVLVLAFLASLAAFGAAAGAEDRPIVLLPLNVEEVPPEFLADGDEIMDALLARELRQRGLYFVQLSLVDGIRRWTNATTAIGGLVVNLEGVERESVERARRHMLVALVEEFDASAVVWPDLRVRRAKQEVLGAQPGTRLEWDGVSRRIPGARLGFESPSRGSSLRVRVYDPDADLVHDVHQGLEVIDFLFVARREYHNRGYHYERTMWYDHRMRSDLFEDEELLEEAVAAALPEVWP